MCYACALKSDYVQAGSTGSNQLNGAKETCKAEFKIAELDKVIATSFFGSALQPIWGSRVSEFYDFVSGRSSKRVSSVLGSRLSDRCLKIIVGVSKESRLWNHQAKKRKRVQDEDHFQM